MKTVEELQAIRDRMKSRIVNRDVAGDDDIRVVVGMATCGIASGARAVLNAVSEEISSKKLEKVKLNQTGCMGICSYEPIMEISAPGKEKVTYVKMTPEKVRTVFQSHILNGKPVAEYTYNYVKGENK